MGWMNVSPWVLTVRKQGNSRSNTLWWMARNWRVSLIGRKSRHLQYSNRLKYKDCEMSQILTALFFIELNSDLTPASGWMLWLECRINLMAVTNKCKKTKGSAQAREMTHWPLACESKMKHFIHYKSSSDNELLGAPWCGHIQAEWPAPFTSGLYSAQKCMAWHRSCMFHHLIWILFYFYLSK